MVCRLVYLTLSFVVCAHIAFSQVPSPEKTRFLESHGKQAYDRALALSKNAQRTIPEAKNYDVTYYKIDISIVINVMQFGGSSTMTLTSLADGLDTVKYDFHERGHIDSVFVNGTLVQHSHIADIINAPLPLPLNTGESVTIRTVYSYPFPSDALIVKGVTNENLNKSTYSIASHVEPYAARKWWPCKDDPADKADSIDILITTNSYLEVVSNGTLLSDTPAGDNKHTVHWKSRYPIATYLVSIALSEYSRNDYMWQYNGHSMPVTTWIFRENNNEITETDASVLETLTMFSDLFGIYPFYEEKYGMAEYVWGGAMEHQTVSSMGAFYPDIAVHELAHQWFGDKVTCASFEHIWLNEGWATYCEALYYEFKYGVTARNSTMSNTRYFGPGKIFVDDPENKDKARIFDGNLTYNKSSWVVHMLRGVVGDSAFFRATRKYIGTLQHADYRSVTTEEFQQFYEDESGMDLDFFFDEWIHSEYYPSYAVDYSTEPYNGSYRTTVAIEQVQALQHQVFTMPIELRFRFPAGDSTLTIWNDTQLASYEFIFDETPTGISFDPNRWILKQLELPVKPLVNPDYDHTVLLVNGVQWTGGTSGNMLRQSYADEVYTSNYPYVFYDLYPYPEAGYPEGTPIPAGSAALPLEELEKFCTVIWLGGANEGDMTKAAATPLLEYVQRGGNLILAPVIAGYYIDDMTRSYLGINWMGSPFSYYSECKSVKPYLVDMEPVQVQYPVSVIAPSISNPNTELLFMDEVTQPAPVGIGVWNKPHPTEYGTSGNFILLSMIAHEMDQQSLKYNMSVLLDSIMCDRVVSAGTIAHPRGLSLEQNYPNPTSSRATFTYTIGTKYAQQSARIEVFNCLGRLVAVPVQRIHVPGTYSVDIPASDLTPGTYQVRLRAGSETTTTTMVVLP